MCVLCKIDKAYQDINYLKFDKCVEIIGFSNRQSRAISLPPPAPSRQRLLCRHVIPEITEGHGETCSGDPNTRHSLGGAGSQERRGHWEPPSMSWSLVKLGAGGGY